MSNRTLRTLKTAVVVSIILGLTAAAGYLYWQNRQLTSNNPEKEIQEITKRLRKFMELPESPLPTLATVTEKEKLQQQEFFQKAENGDKVLIYLSEGKAILYRPSTGKVIDIAPVRQTDTPAQEPDTATQSQETSTETIAITLYNGSTVAGATRTAESELSELSFEYSVSARANAARTDYTETLVVDLDGSFATQATELADLLEGRVAEFPSGERRPVNGGLLVIIGQPSPDSESATPIPSPSSAESQ